MEISSRLTCFRFSKLYCRRRPRRDLLNQHRVAASGTFLASCGWNGTAIPRGTPPRDWFPQPPPSRYWALSLAVLVSNQVLLPVEASCPSRSRSRSLQVKLFHVNNHLKKSKNYSKTPIHSPSQLHSLCTLVTPLSHTIKNAGWILTAF
jgi:hypothetical protein